MITDVTPEKECQHIYGWDDRYAVPILQPYSMYEKACKESGEDIEVETKDMRFYKHCSECGKMLK